MKRIYFKRILIDKDIILDFFNRHQEMNKFLNKDDSFFIRTCTKPYPGLLHAIISQNQTNNQIIETTAFLSKLLRDNIKPRKVIKLDLEEVFGAKAPLIKQITQDVISKKLNLKKLMKLSTNQIIDVLTSYEGLNVNTAKEFALFTCGKKDVLCLENFDFLIGLRLFLNKTKISNEDIDKIKNEYTNDGTLFSLCMWKIRFSKHE